MGETKRLRFRQGCVAFALIRAAIAPGFALKLSLDKAPMLALELALDKTLALDYVALVHVVTVPRLNLAHDTVLQLVAETVTRQDAYA